MTTFLGVPILGRGEAWRNLYLTDKAGGEEFTADDERLLTSFATSAASAVVTARSVTVEQMRAREAATEQERRRWARELHDETLQGLGALRVALSTARRTDDPAAWREALDDALTGLDAEIANVRGIIADVRPASLDELGITAALEALADRMRGRGIGVELRMELGPTRYDEEVETAVYRLAQEGITNAIKHAEAETVTIELSETDGRVTLRVRDEGRGFDVSASTAGFGLVGMRERVEAIGGVLMLESKPGAGVTLTARLPARRRSQRFAAPADAASITAGPSSSTASSSRT
jgi:signal transduction histidine kinase